MSCKQNILARNDGVVIGPATRGTVLRTLSCVINDAFGGSAPVTFSGDWVAQNNFDGFDRFIDSTDAAGGMVLTTFDPGGRTIASQSFGTSGGPTPADRTGSSNIMLASSEARFDEAGRQYEAQRDIFLDAGYYGAGPAGLPSGRTVTHTGGGLAINSTANDHTDTVTLTAGGRSYVLSRTVFDRADRVTATASDNGAVATMTLDGAGRAIQAQDALGNIVKNTFDANGNVTFTTRIEKCTISDSIATESFSSAFAIDVLNRTIVQMDQGADGSLTADWPICCADATTATLVTYFGFDSRNNRTNLVDAKQNTTIWDFDGASRQLREKRQLRPSGDGTTAIYATVLTQTAYDANSNTLRLVDNNGGTTAWLYDLLDRNTVMQFHDGSTRTNVFDAASDIVVYTDENGSVFANTWDVLGRKTAVGITPAAGVAGNAALTGTPGTIAQGFAFDGLSRVTFSRDSVGTAGLSGLTNADAGLTYDSISRILEEQQTYAGDVRFVTHNAWTSYPATGFTFPNNRQTTIGFDALYRKNAINETSDGSNIAAWQFFGYRTATVTLGNGIVTSFMNDAQTRSAVQLGQTTPAWGDISTDHLGYDGSGRMIGKRHILSGSVLVGFTTAYDPSSNKLFERALHAESRSALYANDSMDRLLSYSRGVLATGGGSVTTPITLPNTDSQRNYALDGLGNWRNTAYTPVGSSPGLDVRTHNKLNQITVFDAPSSPTPILYDQGNNAGSPPQKGNGNIIDDGTRLNAFDALNRLITVTRKIGTVLVATYAYDALGRRIIKDVTAAVSGTVPTGTSRYLLDGQRIVEELNGTTGSATLQYIWGQYIDELVQLNALVSVGPQGVTGKNYLLSDLLYRSAALTGSGGTIVEAYDTDAYGNTLLFSAHGTDGLWFTNDDVQADYSACRYVFTGREWDAEREMYFYRARYYHTSLGRFIGRDPARAAAENIYALVGGQPGALCDPLGLKAAEPEGDITFYTQGTPTNQLGDNDIEIPDGNGGVVAAEVFVTTNQAIYIPGDPYHPSRGWIVVGVRLFGNGGTCVHCHWLQFVTARYLDAQNHPVVGAAGVGVFKTETGKHLAGTVYADGKTGQLFYGGQTNIYPFQSSIADKPSFQVTPQWPHQRLSFDDFLVCYQRGVPSVYYHVHWEANADWGTGPVLQGDGGYANVSGELASDVGSFPHGDRLPLSEGHSVVNPLAH